MMCPCTLLVAPVAEHKVVHGKCWSPAQGSHGAAREPCVQGRGTGSAGQKLGERQGLAWTCMLSVKHPAQKHTKITPAARANISHPCSHHAPYSGPLSSSPSALRQCLTPPPDAHEQEATEHWVHQLPPTSQTFFCTSPSALQSLP